MTAFIGRREFITLLGGAATAWPLVTRAQQHEMPVIGLLNSATLDSQAERLDLFRQGLKDTGLVEGQNVRIEYRSAEGQFSQLPAFAAELVRRRVAVLAANTTASALAAKRASATIPIVFVTGGDPVELGLVTSLNRPSGNATGVSFLVNKLVAKRLELLIELVPGAASLAILVDPNNPNALADTRDAQDAADAVGRRLLIVKSGAENELDAAFATLVEQRVSALLVAANVNFGNWRDKLVMLAARHAIPASYPFRDFVAAGGLMSYGTSIAEAYRQMGVYTGRILKGDKPADLPVQQAVRVELVINLKSAKTLGLEIPGKLLALADEVIE
jgi:putative ABC transport system substrate-binding protein